MDVVYNLEKETEKEMRKMGLSDDIKPNDEFIKRLLSETDFKFFLDILGEEEIKKLFNEYIEKNKASFLKEMDKILKAEMKKFIRAYIEIAFRGWVCTDEEEYIEAGNLYSENTWFSIEDLPELINDEIKMILKEVMPSFKSRIKKLTEGYLNDNASIDIKFKLKTKKPDHEPY